MRVIFHGVSVFVICTAILFGLGGVRFSSIYAAFLFGVSGVGMVNSQDAEGQSRLIVPTTVVLLLLQRFLHSSSFFKRQLGN